MLGSKSLKSVEQKQTDLIEEAKSEIEDLKQDSRLKLKEDRDEMEHRLESDFQRRKDELKKSERTVKERELQAEKRISETEKIVKDMEHRELSLQNEKTKITETKEYYRNLIDKANERLEAIAGMSKEEVLENLKQNLLSEARQYTDKLVTDMFEEARKEANKRSKDIVLQAINQTASDHSVESTISVVTLPEDSMKGRIIGREERNIRSFELNTGTDILIDDTPKTIILSCFNPIRREVAKIALERLIEDGRIHPGRIEDVVEKVEEEMNDSHFEAG